MSGCKKVLIISYILIFTFGLYLYFFVSRPAVKTLCVVETEASVRNIINKANENLLSIKPDYDKLFSVKTTQDGEVCFVSANTGLVNQLSMLWGTDIQNGLNSNKLLEVKKPFGAFLGSPFLADYGKTFTLTINFSAISRTEYKSVFARQGINQTIHRLYLVAYVDVKIISPIETNPVVIEDTFLFCESVLNGKVPDTYISSENFSDYFDLIS